jgi:hypothetical protein
LGVRGDDFLDFSRGAGNNQTVLIMEHLMDSKSLYRRPNTASCSIPTKDFWSFRVYARQTDSVRETDQSLHSISKGKARFTAEVRWLPELDVEKRMQGDSVWFKVVSVSESDFR